MDESKGKSDRNKIRTLYEGRIKAKGGRRETTDVFVVACGSMLYLCML